MADKSRERNSVDLFSDYGLDERQKSLSKELAAKSFRMLCLLVYVLTGLWTVIYFSITENIPFVFVGYSYFAAAVFCYCYYAVKSAKLGLINQVTSFSFTTGNLFTAIFALVMAAIAFAFMDKSIARIAIVAMFILISAEQFVLYFCGKQNFKALDKQAEEDDEE